MFRSSERSHDSKLQQSMSSQTRATSTVACDHDYKATLAPDAFAFSALPIEILHAELPPSNDCRQLHRRRATMPFFVVHLCSSQRLMTLQSQRKSETTPPRPVF